MQQGGELSCFLFFAVGLVTTVVLVAVFAHNQAQAALNERLRELARKYQGSFYPGGAFEDPRLRLSLAGQTALLQFLRHGKNDHRTQLAISWPQTDLRLELRPTALFDGLGAFFGLEDLEIGSPEFDAQYRITGNNLQRIREFLTPAVQEVLGAIGRLGSWGGGVHLEIGGGQLRVTCSRRLTEANELGQFVRLGERLAELARAQSSEGITFVEGASAANLAERPHCLVCGEPLAGQLVTCTRCKTVHHRECWDYFGSCATYGCGCKSPRAAPPLRRNAG